MIGKESLMDGLAAGSGGGRGKILSAITYCGDGCSSFFALGDKSK
jgi:hypothetical protein